MVYRLRLMMTALLATQPLLAAEAPARESALNAMIRGELARKSPAARVDLIGDVRWVAGRVPAEVTGVRLIGESARGEASFVAHGPAGSAQGVIHYASWLPARTAIRRIQPGQRLTPEMFVTQEINVASGQGYEYRGVILGGETDVRSLETRQTVLEGGMLLSTAVQRVPDVRRGDTVRIRLVSGGLTLSLTGTAEEAAYLEGAVRVITTKSKRELVGQLQPDRLVEVRL